MNDPSKPNQEPRRVSQPNQPSQPQKTKPVEAPGSEYEKEVPHSGEPPVAHTGKFGEGSYEGTREYAEGYEEFARSTSPDESVKKGQEIDPNDPVLKEAEERAKSARVSSTSIH